MLRWEKKMINPISRMVGKKRLEFPYFYFFPLWWKNFYFCFPLGYKVKDREWLTYRDGEKKREKWICCSLINKIEFFKSEKNNRTMTIIDSQKEIWLILTTAITNDMLSKKIQEF